MKMTLLTRQWSCRALLIIGAGSSPGLYADVHQAGRESVLDNAQACAEEPSRLDRLSCYDDVFKPTLTATNDSELSDLWYAIERQEAERDTQALGLMVEQVGDDVLMSVPALGTTPPRPVMVMACEKAITRFQLHMPEPVNAARVDLQLSTNTGSIQQQWRVRDDGHVLNGGRGLPAIETLRQLLNANEVTLASDVAVLNGLRFDITGLRQAIQPMREACRW